jgi:hypothetical protein
MDESRRQNTQDREYLARIAARRAKDALRASEEETVHLRNLALAAAEMVPHLERLGIQTAAYERLRCALLGAALCSPDV